MLEKLIIGTLGISALMAVWALVQQLWRATFHDIEIEEDILAGRSGCSSGSCGCANPCKYKKEQLSKHL